MGNSYMSTRSLRSQKRDVIQRAARAMVEARAWMRDQAGGEGARVMNLDLSPNRIGLRVQGPGKLILSEIAYPGWQARVDGESAAIETSFDLLRSVYVPAGDHTVEFTFTPWTVLAGAALTIIGGLSILGLWMRR